tara:strand:- start:270 stop:1892 length:1623 start_codon:yes stop_codon:yes gene_type:complete
MKINISSKKTVVFLFFTIILLTGIFVYKDYGLTIDDEYYRKNGFFYKEFITKYIYHLFNVDFVKLDLLSNEIQNNSLRNHPATFEIILAFLSDFLKLNQINEIYNLSHLLNFIIYTISLYLFYKILNKRFKNSYLSILFVIIIFLTPRFFAESFYNSRDIFFFSLFILFLYSAQKYIYKDNIQNILLISFSSALLINAKVLGIIPFILFFIMYLSYASDMKKENIKIFKQIFFIIILTIFFIIILWPYLWFNPFDNFLSAYIDIIKVQNDLKITTFYAGDYLAGNNTPWHYRLVWFYITTPLIVCILFSLALIYLVRKLVLKILNLNNINSILWNDKDDFFDFYLVLLLLSIIFLTIKFNVSQFGGWRHLYFLYAIIIYLSGFICNLCIKHKKKIFIKSLSILILLNVLYNIYWIYKNHPNQNNFFNILFANYAQKNFDLDYWGLSNLNALKFIINNEKKNNIKVSTISFSDLKTSVLKLEKKDRERIQIVFDSNEADYLIDSYMRRPRKNFIITPEDFKVVYDLKVNNTSINTVYKKLE